MSKNAILLGVGLVDNMSKDLARISKNLRANGRNLASIGSELTQGVTIPVVAAGAAMLKFAGDLDAMKRALAANMGSASAASVEFEKLRKAAEAPGIGLEEALRGSIQLQALGANADEARTMLLGLAKAVELSGGGQWEFGRLTTQFIQMVGNGRILQEDLKFMFQAAPKLRGIVQDIFGTSDPEKLRGITNVKEFVEKTTAALNKLEGTGGSVKNTLENLWTSIKVGTGEIGLAILKTGKWGDDLDRLPKALDNAVASAVDWINKNRELTATIIKLTLALAALGPAIRLLGNLKIVGGILAGIGAGALKAAASIQSMTYAAYGVKGLGALFGGFAIAVAVVNTELSKITNKQLWDEMQTNANNGIDSILNRFQALVAGIHQILFTLNWEGAFENFDKAFNGATPMGAFPIKKSKWSGIGGGDRSNITGNERSIWDGYDPADPNADEAKRKAQDAYEARVKLQREMAEMFKESPVKSLYEQYQPNQGGIESMKNIKPTTVPIKQSDVKILEEYAKALGAIKIEEKLGQDAMDSKAAAVNAAADAYRSMVSAYGITSDQAVSALATWKTATDELTDAQKKHNEELQKQANIMSYVSTISDGLTDALVSLVTEGSKGVESFGKSILKLATNILKMAVAQFIGSAISSLGIFGAPVAIAGATGFFSAAKSAINGVSLAEGGMLTGETIVRAGEYQGVQADPEVISPVSKIQKYIREAVGSGGGNMHAVIRGDDILLVTSKAQDRASRRGSANVISF